MGSFPFVPLQYVSPPPPPVTERVTLHSKKILHKYHTCVWGVQIIPPTNLNLGRGYRSNVLIKYVVCYFDLE